MKTLKPLKSEYFFSVIIISFIIMIPLIAYAAVSYKSDPGTTIIVNEHGICKKVKNTGTNSYFIPTNTLSEWNSFISANSYLTDITLENCATYVYAGIIILTEEVTSLECDVGIGTMDCPDTVVQSDVGPYAYDVCGFCYMGDTAGSECPVCDYLSNFFPRESAREYVRQ